jgi:hypothetical protein
MSVTPVIKIATEALGGEDGIPITSIGFYPAERVHEIFDRLKAAKGTDREESELRIFAERITYLYENQTEESNTALGIEKTARLAAVGEAVEDAERTANIMNGARQ